MRRANFTFLTIIAVLCATCLVVQGDTLKLKDGTTVEGTIIPRGSSYWIKFADGTTRLIPKDQVVNYTKGDTAAPAPANAPAVPAPSKAAEHAADDSSASTQSFLSVKSRADHVDTPVIAVQLWEKYLDSNASADDAAKAKTELEKWQKLDKAKAEKINGAWVGGAEKKALQQKVSALCKEGYEAIEGSKSIEGMKKLEEALKLYPDSFEANFGLGYFYLVKGAIGPNGRGNIEYQEKAVKSLETAAKLSPTSAAAWSNLAIGYNFRGKYIDSVNAAYKAVKIEDSKETVQNLVNSIAAAPPGLQRNNETLKPVIEDALVLAGKHGVSRQGGQWTYLPPSATSNADLTPTQIAAEGKPGPAWSGSGFFVNDEGYFITNHHVATGDPKSPILKNITFRVRLDDGTEKSAEIVAVDEKADIALMKIKPDAPTAFLTIADDNPKQAAKALVLGYPATGEDEPTLQISEGQVKSLHPAEEYEVWYDLNTTHGNSGGPIVDKNCHLISILSGGRQVYNVWYVMGVGPKQIQTFLKTLGSKAPSLKYVPAGDGEFDGEKLTERARKATVLVTAIRGVEGDAK